MKISRILFIILTPILIAFGGIIYFVAQFSAVYPPLNKYPYSKSMTQFKSDLESLSETNKKISFSITDTTGNLKNGYSYYITIEIKDSNKYNEYRVAYKKDDQWFGKNETKIYLIGAFDMYRKSGGYKTKDKDVKRLVQLFEKDFYNLLNKEMNTSP